MRVQLLTAAPRLIVCSIDRNLRMVGWPGRVRSTGRVAQRQEAAPCGFVVDRGTPVDRLLHRPQFAGVCRTMGERSSCEQREWHSLLFLRNPAALRDGRATRTGRAWPGGPVAHDWVARPRATAPAGSRSDKRPRPVRSLTDRGTLVNHLPSISICRRVPHYRRKIILRATRTAQPLVPAEPGRPAGRPDFMKEWSSWILHVDGVSRCEDRQCSVHETRRTTLCCTQALTSTASRSPSAFATKREM